MFEVGTRVEVSTHIEVGISLKVGMHFEARQSFIDCSTLEVGSTFEVSPIFEVGIISEVGTSFFTLCTSFEGHWRHSPALKLVPVPASKFVYQLWFLPSFKLVPSLELVHT